MTTSTLRGEREAKTTLADTQVRGLLQGYCVYPAAIIQHTLSPLNFLDFHAEWVGPEQIPAHESMRMNTG